MRQLSIGSVSDFLLVLAEIVGLESQAIDFALAFPQAELDVPVYMELPMGIEVENSNGEKKQHVLRLRKSLYGLKQASANWYDMLRTGLQLRGFRESIADPCVFVKSGSPNDSNLHTGATLFEDGRTFNSIEESKSPCTATINYSHQQIAKFIKYSSDILVLVYIDNCIILS